MLSPHKPPVHLPGRACPPRPVIPPASKPCHVSCPASWACTSRRLGPAIRAARNEDLLPEKESPVGTPGGWASEEFHQRMRRKAALHRGVAWSRKYRRFRAAISVAGQNTHLGQFQTAEAAAAAFEAARTQQPYRRPPARRQSQYTGVSWMKNDNRWRARVVFNGRETHLGLFYEQSSAAQAVLAHLDTFCGGHRSPRGIYLDDL